ncbi:MAG: META domain-containing protein, partial [Methanomicrobiales archaeon]|nr:META domain-containing protein [Methanomicrobiales archaeon]
MKDRMNFLQILSLLIAATFLISVITPVSASGDAGRQTRLTSILAAHGAADTMVGHELVGYIRGMPDTSWPGSGSISPSGVDRDALFREIRSGPGVQPVLLPDSGFSWSLVGDSVSKNRSSLMDELIRNHQKTGTGVSKIISGQGIVRFIDLEGGFYGIVIPSGDQFIPDNLPRAFMADGIPVRFTAMIGNQEPGITMWGKTIHLISCEKIDRTFSKQGTVRFIDLEGGFYGIVTATGEQYLPMNLAPEFSVDGFAVEFTARERLDLSTTAMWGVPVELISISAAGRQETPLTGSWKLISYRDGAAWRTPVPGTEITAVFGDDDRLSGSAGCNRYFTSYNATNTDLTVGPVGSTKMYCAGAMDQESAYLQLLATASAFMVEEEILTITDQSGRAI